MQPEVEVAPGVVGVAGEAVDHAARLGERLAAQHVDGVGDARRARGRPGAGRALGPAPPCARRRRAALPAASARSGSRDRSRRARRRRGAAAKRRSAARAASSAVDGVVGMDADAGDDPHAAARAGERERRRVVLDRPRGADADEGRRRRPPRRAPAPRRDRRRTRGSATWQCESTSSGPALTRRRLDARETAPRAGRVRWPGGKLVPHASVERVEVGFRQPELPDQPARRLGQDGGDQLGGRAQRLAQLVQDGADARPLRRVLRQPERRRLGDVLVGVVERAPDRLEPTMEGELLRRARRRRGARSRRPRAERGRAASGASGCTTPSK